MTAFIQYLKDVRSELSHVSWPTQRQAVVFSLLVILISAVTAIFLGVFDYAFTTLLDVFVGS